MKKLISFICISSLCSFGYINAQEAPTGPVGGPDGGPTTRPVKTPLPRPILNNPDFQDFVKDFQAFRTNFKNKMQDFRRQMAEASEAEKATIRAERQDWLRTFRSQQTKLRKEVRKHTQAARKAREAAGG